MGCCCKKRKEYAQCIKEDGKGKELEEKNPSKNNYEIIKSIGKGAFGEVFLVRLKSDKTQYFAMKKLKKEKFKKISKLVRNERDVGTYVKSPFVISIIKAFQDTENLYLVSEYVRGKDLYYYWKKKNKKFSLSLTRFYIAELILALEDLHGQNIVHRDIKLENILLDEKGHIKLTDFGLSKILKDDDNTNTMVGTPTYIAPEVFNKLGHNKTADWWSVGCLMFAMLEGRFPFTFDYNYYQRRLEKINYKEEIEFKIIKDKDKDSINAKDLIRKFLAMNPKNRLGAGENGINNIKSHAFFEGINWVSARKQELDPPLKPKIENIEEVKGRFDELLVNDDIDKNDKNYYRGFSFEADSGKNTSDLKNDNNDNDNNNDNNNEKLLDKENNESSDKQLLD